MKKTLSNQKGYSLVELLVAMAIFAIVLTQIFAMMQHSARLYKNGTYEVDLQTEAQQFVQQMEELLIDVSASVNVTGTPSSNYSIQIINKDPITGLEQDYYTVTFVKDPAADFGVVQMSASGNITAADMPMAEYVQSVSLDMTEYTSADKVVLCVSMNNGQYSYETSKDIYLRNGVGSGTGGAMSVPEGDFDEELDVLRFKEYDLTNLYQIEGVTMPVFEFEDVRANQDFSITIGPNGHYILQCSATRNSYIGWQSATNYFNILAKDPVTGSVKLKIQIVTKEVKVLPDGYGIAFALVGSDEEGGMNAVQVQGIDMTAAESAVWTMYWHTPGGDLAGNPKTGLEWIWATEEQVKNLAKNDMGDEVRIDHLTIEIANIDNTEFGYNGLMVLTDGLNDTTFSLYRSALMQSKCFYIKACFSFPGVSETFDINILFSAVSKSTALDDQEVRNFWNMCEAFAD